MKNEDNIGEFDPFFVERIKNCMSLLYQKNFIGRMQDEIFKYNTLKEPRQVQETKKNENSPRSPDHKNE